MKQFVRLLGFGTLENRDPLKTKMFRKAKIEVTELKKYERKS